MQHKDSHSMTNSKSHYLLTENQISVRQKCDYTLIDQSIKSE